MKSLARLVTLYRDKGKAGDAFRGHLVIFAVCVLSAATVAAGTRSLLPLLLSPVMYLAYVVIYKTCIAIGEARKRARQKRLMKNPSYRAYVERLNGE